MRGLGKNEKEPDGLCSLSCHTRAARLPGEESCAIWQEGRPSGKPLTV